MVQQVGHDLGLNVAIYHYDNPRKELDQHYFNPDRQHLIDLGYQPTHDVKSEIQTMLQDLMYHQKRITDKQHMLVPDIRWDGTRRRSHIIDTKKAFQS
jgi:UDP-sulfoquinovose synthase